ncbi:MAG: hypothetical protein K6B13_06355 [Prevotella sp.]|nr:hypothetical protein [Prevotella sp.]
MKKTYISPKASIILIEAQLMSAGSTLSSNPGENENVQFTEQEYNGEGASRQSFNVWGEEEEENY